MNSESDICLFFCGWRRSVASFNFGFQSCPIAFNLRFVLVIDHDYNVAFPVSKSANLQTAKTEA